MMSTKNKGEKGGDKKPAKAKATAVSDIKCFTAFSIYVYNMCYTDLTNILITFFSVNATELSALNVS